MTRRVEEKDRCRFRFRREQSTWIADQLREYCNVQRNESSWRLLHEAFLVAFSNDPPSTLRQYTRHARRLERKATKASIKVADEENMESIRANQKERRDAEKASRSSLVDLLSRAPPPKRQRPEVEASSKVVHIKKEDAFAPSQNSLRHRRFGVDRRRYSGGTWSMVMPCADSLQYHPERPKLSTAGSGKGKQLPAQARLPVRTVKCFSFQEEEMFTQARPKPTEVPAAQQQAERLQMQVEDLASQVLHKQQFIQRVQKVARRWRQQCIEAQQQCQELKDRQTRSEATLLNLEKRLKQLEGQPVQVTPQPACPSSVKPVTAVSIAVSTGRDASSGLTFSVNVQIDVSQIGQ